MSGDTTAAMTEEEETARWHRIGRIVEHLESQSIETAAIRTEALVGCGPLLKRLVLAAEEAHVGDILTVVFDRAHALFAPWLHVTTDAARAEKTLAIDAAAEASRLLLEEALPPPERTTPRSTLEEAVWCRTGQLVLRLVRESTTTSISSNSNRAAEPASALLLQRIPWGRDGDAAEPCESDSGAGKPGEMVSAFTMLWGAVFLFLQSLASGVELSEVRDDAAPVPTGRQHPLLQIAADCVVVMVEHNRALLREAREMSRVGVAAEVLCVALNNYAWLQHYSTKILMTDRAAVAELLSQCTADALQDVVTGFVGDVQYVLAMYLAPRSTERPRITRRVLTTRLLAVRSFCSSLARSLPRQEILSLVLERALRPVAEQLLEEKDQHVVDWSSGSNSGGVAGALHSASLSPGAPFIGAVEDEDADGGEDSMTMAQRLTEALRILESDAAFGSVLCLQSSSFCTIRRLQSIMAP